METKNIILKLRMQKGLSQDELAEKIMVTRQAVSRWENGEDEFVPEGAVKVSHRHRSCGIMCLCEIKEFRKSVFERGWNMNYE